MCTAACFQTLDHYFGRNLDLAYSYRETVTITPRKWQIQLRKMGKYQTTYAMIGVAYVKDGQPLYYDATNERGVSIAGLNFPENAFYEQARGEMDEITPFELIPWLLGQCASLAAVRTLLKKLRIINLPYNDELPVTPLHWLIADQTGAIVVECIREGMKVYENPVGILTNNPPFDYHLQHLQQFLSLSAKIPVNRFSDQLQFKPFSLGMGSLGLPGDYSSPSRFVRAAFVKMNSKTSESEAESIGQFFHILSSVEMPLGCVQAGDREYAFTRYSSCCNMDRGLYYYRTYHNSQITCVDMHRENLNAQHLISYPLIGKQKIWLQNETRQP